MLQILAQALLGNERALGRAADVQFLCDQQKVAVIVHENAASFSSPGPAAAQGQTKSSYFSKILYHRLSFVKLSHTLQVVSAIQFNNLQKAISCIFL